MCLMIAAATFFVIANFMGLPSGAVDPSGVMDSIPTSAMDYLAVEKPEAIDLLNQVQNGVAYYMIIPLILVVGLAICGVNTFACIGSGIVSAYILGLFAGTTSLYPILSTADGVDSGLQAYLNMCVDGFAEAGKWVVVMMMWVAAFGGIMGKMKAFEPLSNLIVKVSRNVRQLMFCNGLLSLAGNAILSDEMAQIVTVGPIIKDITENNVEGEEEDMYKLKLRNATFGDAMGVFGSQLIPWHVYLAFYVGVASNVYPLYTFVSMDFIKFNFMAMIAVASILILTLTGLDRLIPLFGLPKEPKVRLKKKEAKKEA